MSRLNFWIMEKKVKRIRTCKICRSREAAKASLNCEKCNNKVFKKTIIIPDTQFSRKSNTALEAYGGLGNEWETGIAGHCENFWIMAKKPESPSELIELFNIVREDKQRHDFIRPPEYPQICQVYHLICNDLRNKRYDRIEELRMMWQNITSY